MSKKNGSVSDWPDERHFLRLQEALWTEVGSRPSLMVGAGFSQNAQSSPGVRTQFPTWSTLADYMAEELYPSEDRSSDATSCRRSARSPERIAREYEVIFGRGALEDLIRKRLPDAGHEPDSLHELLLRLPWQDVFTTNYDTLLERTSVPGRSYHTVATVRELTRARPPRIIKLHGSLNSDARLIATEEDYRTYPRDFAPFVNTVRQTLIERSLVLVGFSGDDRNFLEWTGWMRDELGDHHCPIYLVVVHGLDDIQRSLLEKRGVTPIDLTCQSKCGDGDAKTPAALVRDFVERLWQAQPRGELWSVSMTRIDPDELGPADTDEATATPTTDEGDPSDGKIESALRQWQKERKAYPGWVIAPASRRREVWHATMNWIEPVLRASAKWASVDRVVLLSELNWRLEIAMAPLLPQWLEQLEEAIDGLSLGALTEDDDGRRTERKGIVPESEWSVRDATVGLFLALVRAARETHDPARWNRHMERIGGEIEKSPGLRDRYHHERALWQLSRIDRDQVGDVVREWTPTDRAPLGLMWKAGVLVEIGREEEARELLRGALRAIRRDTHGSRGRSVELLSMEGWCAYLLFYVETSLTIGRHAAVKEEFEQRWRELRAADCDPWQAQEYFAASLNKEPPRKPRTVRRAPGFDPGTWLTTRQLGHGGVGPWLPAFGCLRWAEEVGLPPRTQGLFGVAQSELIRAAIWVSRFLPARGISILVRMGAVKMLREKNVVSRPRIAEMDQGDVEALSEIMLTAVVRESRFLRGQQRQWLEVNILNALVEVASRVTLRLDGEGLMKSFETAMGVYAGWRGKDVSGLAQGLRHWFRRLYEAADEELLARWLPALLDAPVVPEQNVGGGRKWHDPLDGFPIRRLAGRRGRSGKVGKMMRGAVGRLLQSGRLESGVPRATVVWRLSGLWRENLLTAAERGRAGSLLWADTAPGTLPYWRELRVEDYTAVPSPEGVDVSAVIKRRLLGDAERSALAAGDEGGRVIGATRGAVLEVGPATRTLVEIPSEPLGLVKWEPQEVARLWRAMSEWWSAAREVIEMEQDFPLFGEGDEIRARAPSVEMFLVRVRVAAMDGAREEEWEGILNFVKEARQFGVLLTAAKPYFLVHRPHDRDATAECVIEDLATGEETVAVYAARAVRHWVHLAGAELVEPVPAAVVGSLVDRVAFRRLEGAASCVRELSALLVEKGAAFGRESVDPLISGLHAWDEAVAPETDDYDRGGIPLDERPDLRERVGVLANALGTWWRDYGSGRALPKAVRGVLDKYAEDPLPEVRRAVSEGRWRYR